MTENNLQEKRVTDNIKRIHVDQIKPSPYQHRKVFQGIEDLAENIQRDGLIHPIVVRDKGDHFELVVGERRLRAVRLIDDEILADIRVLTDLQARRMVAAENMQRDNPSDVEFTRALLDVIDAELYDHPDYLAFGDESGVRVKTLLSKLNSDDRNGTNYFTNKFISKVNEIFKSLPKKKTWQSFFMNDLPLLNIDIEVLEIAEANGLNKSQTKSLDKLKKENQEAFKKLVGSKDEKSEKVVVGNDDDGEVLMLRDMSAKEINRKTFHDPFEIVKNHVHVSQNSGNNEWYTPEKYLESARVVMGSIDFDPASCEIANRFVKAETYHTVNNCGLSVAWSGNVWMNPPYEQPLIQSFCDKLIEQIDNIEQAIVLVNNATETKWFHTLARQANAICFNSSRIKFLNHSGVPAESPLQGQAFIYFGNKVNEFANEFEQHGFVVEVL